MGQYGREWDTEESELKKQAVLVSPGSCAQVSSVCCWGMLEQLHWSTAAAEPERRALEAQKQCLPEPCIQMPLGPTHMVWDSTCLGQLKCQEANVQLQYDCV